MATSFREVKVLDGWERQLANGAPGTYALLIRLPRRIRLAIGALGVHDFPPGWYVYVGSALGPGGLRARVARHLRADKHPHWHIDRLLAAGQVRGLWLAPGPERRECDLAQALMRANDSRIPVAGFGAGDCDCTSHLLWFKRRPTIARLL
ncbi:MAG: GIY-YIG nuclease family protein [Chloroflexi bacterium]|nr:GIY-YIG nuclease family protein [Chloroflexota bacterium]